MATLTLGKVNSKVGTGRTYRMLLEASIYAKNGGIACVVGADDDHCLALISQFCGFFREGILEREERRVKIGAGKVIFMSAWDGDWSWYGLKFIGWCGRENPRHFVDHWAIEARMGSLLKEWTRYDLPKHQINFDRGYPFQKQEKGEKNADSTKEA